MADERAKSQPKRTLADLFSKMAALFLHSVSIHRLMIAFYQKSKQFRFSYNVTCRVIQWIFVLLVSVFNLCWIGLVPDYLPRARFPL